MKTPIVECVQLLFSVLLCVLVGTPQLTFSTLQYYMLQADVYEDRCVVFHYTVQQPVLCMESRLEYMHVYDTAALVYAFAAAPAFLTARYLGYSFTNFCCNIILAASAVIIADKSDYQWLSDRFLWSYALVSVAGALATFNAMSIAISIAKPPKVRLGLFVGVVSCMQLSPLVWGYICRKLQANDPAVQDVFHKLLWVPCAGLVISLVLMPVCISPKGNMLFKLLDAIDVYFKDPDDIVDPESAPLVDSMEGREDAHAIQSRQLSSVVFSWPFLILVLNYVAQSSSIDTLLVDSGAGTLDDYGKAIWFLLGTVSPILGMLVTPFVFAVPRIGLVKLTLYSSAFVFALTVIQWKPLFKSMYIASTLTGACNSVLNWSTLINLTKCLDLKYNYHIGVAYLLLVAILKSWIFPTVGVAVELDFSNYKYSPFTMLLWTQLVLAALTLRILRNHVNRERRFRLDLEARLAVLHN